MAAETMVKLEPPGEDDDSWLYGASGKHLNLKVFFILQRIEQVNPPYASIKSIRLKTVFSTITVVVKPERTVCVLNQWNSAAVFNIHFNNPIMAAFSFILLCVSIGFCAYD